MLAASKAQEQKDERFMRQLAQMQQDFHAGLIGSLPVNQPWNEASRPWKDERKGKGRGKERGKGEQFGKGPKGKGKGKGKEKGGGSKNRRTVPH